MVKEIAELNFQPEVVGVVGGEEVMVRLSKWDCEGKGWGVVGFAEAFGHGRGEEGVTRRTVEGLYNYPG